MNAVAASLHCLAECGVDPAAEVYERVFAAHPKSRALFIRDVDGAVRAHMMYEAIEAALDLGNTHGFGANLIGCEVVNHAQIGVPATMFICFYETLRDVTRERCGADWTPAMETGWRELLERVCAIVAARTTE